MELSGANRRKREHMASYYEAMVDMGETSSEFLHQIELVHVSSCIRHFGGLSPATKALWSDT